MNQSFFSTTSDWRDADWLRDYQSALKELTGPPRRMLLESPVEFHENPDHTFTPQPMHNYNIPVVERGPFDATLEGSALREEILRHMTLRKTPSPYVREVLMDQQLVGKIARSPYSALTWLSSLDRRMPFTSLTDAAIHTVVCALGL